MARRSNKSIAETLSPTSAPLSSRSDNKNNDAHLALMDRKITLATEGFTSYKFCE